MKRFDFDQGIHETYSAGRSLAPDVLQMWMEAVRGIVNPPEVSQFLDLGAGTGRFSTALATTLDATAVAVDPSLNMLSSCDASVRRVMAQAEALPFRSRSFDLVFASMVLHHIENLDEAAIEVARVLRGNGIFLVRTCLAETLDAPYHGFFPSLAAIERQLLPPTPTVLSTFKTQGLELVGRDRFRQRMNDSWRDYAERIRLRAMSPLRMISDTEFEEGMRALDKEAALETTPTPVFENIDLLQFQLR